MIALEGRAMIALEGGAMIAEAGYGREREANEQMIGKQNRVCGGQRGEGQRDHVWSGLVLNQVLDGLASSGTSDNGD